MNYNLTDNAMCYILNHAKKQIQKKISLHYPPQEQEVVWEQVQQQYVNFLFDWCTDLGGKKNFHNGAGGTYDCIALGILYGMQRLFKPRRN